MNRWKIGVGIMNVCGLPVAVSCDVGDGGAKLCALHVGPLAIWLEWEPA